ncbi:pilin, partial [Patescibacteria group bacterium]|nr:pilin [Patescibacteria group bacterium]
MKLVNEKNKIKILLTILGVSMFFGVLIFAGGQVLAQDTFQLQPVGDAAGFVNTDIRVIIARIIRAAFGLLGIVALCIVLYAGYVIMTSGGQEEKIANGKKILINAVIGLAIIMSAFTITHFILQALTGAIGGGGSDREGSASAPIFESFSGSGALGRIIEDHYPERSQTGVKRNTMIAVTFREAVDPSTIITDTSGNGIFGDCREVAEDDTLNWETDCDQLITTSVQLYVTPAEDDEATPTYLSAAAMAEPDAEGNYYSFIFRPIQYLGNDIEQVWYTVLLNNNIKKSVLSGGDQVGVFDGQRSNYYLWEFETDTGFDFDPPQVRSISPVLDEVIPRNQI